MLTHINREEIESTKLHFLNAISTEMLNSISPSTSSQGLIGQGYIV